MQLNAAKSEPLAPVTAPPAEAVSTETQATTGATNKPKRERKEGEFSRKSRNVPAHLITTNVPFDYTRAESIALAKVAHVLQKAEPLVLQDCLRWAFDQYLVSTFPPHVAAYDALPADQQTAKLPKEGTGTRTRSLAKKVEGMTNADEVRALLIKRRDAALKAQAEADELLAQYMQQADAGAAAA